ncbi:ester cyclase [Streptomyces sp. NPDC088116]|uniref:ester cyclase n=1 Tax=Streptomyces sp. NPDC088116 TaxID=3365825 RepID=UPI0037F717D5
MGVSTEWHPARINHRARGSIPPQEFEATGRQVSYRSVEVYRLEGDRIAEEWVAPDILGLMRQISPTRADH